MPIANGKLKLSAILHQLEDPAIYTFLGQVTGEERAMRVRLLMRQGFSALFGTPQRMTDATTPVAPQPVDAVVPRSRPGRKLAGLGLKGPFQFETSTKQ
jgi:hypothetical protein